jgi:DNA-binding CsgD family transcriptional regulator
LSPPGCKQRLGTKHLAGLGRTGFGILTVFAIVSIAGMGQTHWLEGAPLQAILLFSTLMMAVVALMAVSGPRRMSLFFLYRWMCPTLVIGFAAVILFGSEGGIAAVAASLGGRFTFCLIAQIYFANYAAAGRATPAQASSLGWLFVHAGDLLGVVTWISLEPWVSSEPAAILWVSTLCIVALVVVTMMVMGETSAFLRVPERDAIEAVTSGKTGAIVGTDSEAGTDAVRTGANARCSNDTPLYPDGTDRRSEVVATEPAPNPANESAIEANLEARIAALAAEHRLTPRETEVFALLSQGRSIPYIRDELIISRETAATHAKHIYAKLGVHSRQELIDLVQR